MSLFDGFQLSHPREDSQQSFGFPTPMVERYRPQTIGDFVGLDKVRKVLTNYAAKPFPTAFLFQGGSGTGKTSMGIALAKAIPAEVHHVPSQECTVQKVQSIRDACQYVPWQGFRMHMVLVDEADQMSTAAQTAFLSLLDATNFPPATVFVFTSNAAYERLEPRFLSRCKVLEFSGYGMGQGARRPRRGTFSASHTSPSNPGRSVFCVPRSTAVLRPTDVLPATLRSA